MYPAMSVKTDILSLGSVPRCIYGVLRGAKNTVFPQFIIAHGSSVSERITDFAAK